MTPAQQLDIIRSVEAVESMDDGVSKRDLEVSLKHKILRVDVYLLLHFLD